MLRVLSAIVFGVAAVALTTVAAQQKSPGAGAVIVLETVKGTIEFETYPEEAPKTVARVIELVTKNFYNGQRFHRAEPNFLVQVGDPVSRDVSRQEWWGRQSAGKPIGASEITRKRRHVAGAVAMAYPGTDKAAADSQFFITRRAAPELDGKFTVFGRVLTGQDVVARIQRGDVLKRAYVKE
ncbi:MAG: peptidylprolyl isomerase [Vicinamibacterales bacterium]